MNEKEHEKQRILEDHVCPGCPFQGDPCRGARRCNALELLARVLTVRGARILAFGVGEEES